MENANGKRVIVLGAGVAGMSAAQELIERGFEVEVYERNPIAGGKARSIRVEGSGVAGRKDLPGEHGFRFFPEFYKHVIDTMRRIPATGVWESGQPGKGKTVADNLDQASRVLFDLNGRDYIELPAHFPKSPRDLEQVLDEFSKSYRDQHGIGIEHVRAFAERMWQVLTSCERRRTREYERMSWWEFTNADEDRALAYRKYLVQSMTRSLIAANAKDASAKVVGDIAIQVLRGVFQPGEGADRVLNGPTNDVWIDPWQKYLADAGVKFTFKTRVDKFNYACGRVQSVSLVPVDDRGEDCGQPYSVGNESDYFIAAVPVEAMATLLGDAYHEQLRNADAQFANILTLSGSTEWMNGIQFYFTEPLFARDAQGDRLEKGHVVFLDSPWALTAVSQPQFWQNYDRRDWGNGQVEDIVSVIISDWDAHGLLYQKPAKQCTRCEIENEVLAQIAKHLHGRSDEEIVNRLRSKFAHPPFLDPELLPAQGPDGRLWENRSPLFINKANTWQLQPEAETRVVNLFLAGDYVRTFTQLPTMEAANESGRRAVNGIIKAIVKEDEDRVRREARAAANARSSVVAGARPKPAWALTATGASGVFDGAKIAISFCDIWDLHEPRLFWFWRLRDQIRFKGGLPWRAEVPWFIWPLQEGMIWCYESYVRLTRSFRRIALALLGSRDAATPDNRRQSGGPAGPSLVLQPIPHGESNGSSLDRAVEFELKRDLVEQRD